MPPVTLEPRLSIIKRTVRQNVRRWMYTREWGEFQVEGVKFAEQHDGRILNADDMGLGKSWQTIAYFAIHPEKRPLLIVCPATVKFKWQNEFWMHSGLRAKVLGGEMLTEDQARDRLSAQIKKIRERKKGSPWATERAIEDARQRFQYNRKRQDERVRKLFRDDPRVLIINYEIVNGWLPYLQKFGIDSVVFDECQYIKTQGVTRTKACRLLAYGCKTVMALSGTPIEGKPIEFFPVLQMVRPKEFRTQWDFAFKYCSPVRNHWSGKWDFSQTDDEGLDALHQRLKDIMIRRLKREVLKDLPKKTRDIMPVDISNREEYEEAEQEFLDWVLKKKGYDAWDSASRAEAICRINALKQLAAEGKMRVALRWIEDWLDRSLDKLVVFAVHKSIIRQLRDRFPKALVIDGSVSGEVVRRIKDGKSYETSKRQEIVDHFQTQPVRESQRKNGDGLIIIQIRAGGVGIDLTKAHDAVMLELAWTPGAHDQAEDRLLRIGQTHKVSIYYIVGRETVEERLLEIIQTKDEVNCRVLDGKTTGNMQLLKTFLMVAGRKAA